MQVNSRTNLVLKNVIVGISGQILSKLLGFISRTIFIQTLGVIYLGVNGLFSNVLSILSLAELGIGSAIVFSLYKPLAEKDEKSVESLVVFYSRAYSLVGITIFILGLLVLPFLDYIIKDKPDIQNLTIIYLMYLINTSVSYFFSYKRALFTADQKNFINILYDNMFTFITVSLQIAILLITKEFLLYLFIQIIMSFMSNFMISKRANRCYPYIKNKNALPIPKLQLQEIKKNVYSMFLLKVGGVVVNGTDNLLISSFIGIMWVGLYSNYLMIISLIQTIVTQIFTPITASVGNLVNLESNERSLNIFNKLFYLNFIIYSFVSVNLFVFMNPFITLWIGERFTFSNSIVFVIVLNIYLMGMRRTLWVYTNALGLFYNFRFIPFIEASLNLGASLLLIRAYGIVGVFLGTTISTVFTYLYYEPYIVFKIHFKVRLSEYFKRYIYYITATIISGFLVYNISLLFNIDNWLRFFFSLITANVVMIIVIFLISFKMEEYGYYRTLFSGIFKSRLKDGKRK